MKLLVLLGIFLVKTLLCKAFSIGIILLFFWLKGRKFSPEQWDDYFLHLSVKRLSFAIGIIYCCSALLSTLLCFLLLYFCDYSHAFEIAFVMLFLGAAVTGYRYKKGGKEYIQSRYKRLTDTILQQKEQPS